LDLGNFAQKPRLRLWETALRIFNQFPLFGAGLGAYKSHFSQFCVPGVYKATGHPHNDLLNLLVHSGLAGLVAWCLLWYAVLHSGIYKLVKGAKDIGAQITLSSYSTIPLLFATVATLFAGGMAQCYFTDEEPAAAFWFLIAIAITTATNERTRREESELRVQTAPGDIR